MKILRLDKTGFPVGWISKKEAVTHMFLEEILWELGDRSISMSGGYNKTGLRTVVSLPPVIAVNSVHKDMGAIPALNNPALFRRDGGLCMYCGNDFDERALTRDHIFPRARGGANTWQNVVASCFRCNSHKGCMTPEEAGMPLLAIPFVPNIFEYMYLLNRNILGDQMEYLKTRFSGSRKWAS